MKLTAEDYPELGKCLKYGMVQSIDVASQLVRAQLMIKGVGEILPSKLSVRLSKVSHRNQLRM